MCNNINSVIQYSYHPRDSLSIHDMNDYSDIYHFDTSHQRKPQGYISNIPWEQVYIVIYPAAMVTSQ